MTDLSETLSFSYLNYELEAMKKNHLPDYLLFDLGNVIVDLDIPATYQALARLTETNSPAFQAFLRKEQWLERYETGRLQTDQFIEGIMHYAQPGTTNQDIRDSWNAMLVRIPLHRLQWLSSLRNNFRVGLFSNTNSLHMDWVYQYLQVNFGITNFESYCFDQVYYSHKIGHRKPDKSAFAYILQAIGLSGSDILFIDDLEENTIAARLTGIQAVTHSPEMEIMDQLDNYLQGFAIGKKDNPGA